MKKSTQPRIPLKIDDEIIIRPLANAAHTTRCRVIGAVHGDFILISEPIVMINERLSAIIDFNFLCAYLTRGYLYNFRSRYRRHQAGGIVCMEYPREVEVRRIRKHRRIRVNIETKCAVSGADDWFAADMVDISHGGCRLALHSGAPMTAGTSVSLVFSLPGDYAVKGLMAEVMSINYNGSSEVTEAGLSFSGPPGELSKVVNFCEFCMFFDLE